jgi:acetyl-CoA C-acetyltransferase
LRPAPLPSCTAVIAMATAVQELHERNGRYALSTACIGVGQGIAVVLERV